MPLVCAECRTETDDPESCESCGASPLLDGRYRLEEILGQGASGITYRAVEIPEGRTLCVKELTYRAMSSFEMQELFHREARILRQLDHPGIPNYVDDFALESGKNLSLFLVQEIVRGQTLREEMEETRYTERDVLEILLELSEILVYLQELRPPVFHRDIKPTNVMRNDEGELVLVDFGSVKATTDGAAGGSTVAGTFGYMAPEQHWGQASRATDLYGLGVLGLVLLTREHPENFVGDQHHLDWKGHLDATEPVVDLLDELLQRSVAERPEDAAEAQALIRETIDAIEGGEPHHDDAGPEEQPILNRPDAPSRDTSTRNRTPRASLGAPITAGAEARERTETSETESDRSTIAGARKLQDDPSSSRRNRRVGKGLWIIAGIFIVGALIASFIVLGSRSSRTDGPSKKVVVESPSDEPGSEEADSAVSRVLDRAPQIGSDDSEFEQADSASRFDVESFDTCDPDECAPIDAPIKTDLEFGISVNRAREARRDVAAAEKRSIDTLSEEALPQNDAPRIEPPGPILRTETAIGDRPGHCSLEFFDDGGLSRIACRVGDFDSCREAESFARQSLRRLVARYGRPDESKAGSTFGLEGLKKVAQFDGDDRSIARSWSWHGDGAELTFDVNCASLPNVINQSILGTVELVQASTTHRKILVDLQKQAQKERKKQREENRKQQEQLQEKLRDLTQDDPL